MLVVSSVKQVLTEVTVGYGTLLKVDVNRKSRKSDICAENRTLASRPAFFYKISITEPWYAERGYAEGQPIQGHLPGNHSIVCMLQWLL